MGDSSVGGNDCAGDVTITANFELMSTATTLPVWSAQGRGRAYSPGSWLAKSSQQSAIETVTESAFVRVLEEANLARIPHATASTASQPAKLSVEKVKEMMLDGSAWLEEMRTPGDIFQGLGAPKECYVGGRMLWDYPDVNVAVVVQPGPDDALEVNFMEIRKPAIFGGIELGKTTREQLPGWVEVKEKTSVGKRGNRWYVTMRFGKTTTKATLGEINGVIEFLSIPYSPIRGMHFTPDYPTSCGWPVRLPRRCWTISE